MVSLGFMAKGYRMREDQVRQEEAQKSAMDFKREQFEFRKSAHAETIASTKAQLKDKQKTQETKAAYDFVTLHTGPKANPNDPVQLNILPPNVQAKVLAMNVLRSVIGKDGKITHFPSYETPSSTNWTRTKTDLILNGTLNSDTLTKPQLDQIIENLPDYPENLKKRGSKQETRNFYRKKFQREHERQNQVKHQGLKQKAIDSASKVNKGGLVALKTLDGKHLDFVNTTFIDYSKVPSLGEGGAKQVVARNAVDLANYDTLLKDALADNNMAKYKALIRHVPTHIRKKFESLEKTNFSQLTKNNTAFIVEQSQFEELSKIFKPSNEDLESRIARENGISVNKVRTLIQQGKIKTADGSVVVNAELNTKVKTPNPKLPHTDSGNNPINGVIVEQDELAVKQAKMFRETGEQNSGKPLANGAIAVKKSDGTTETSPILTKNENEAQVVAAVRLQQIALRNPQGVFATPDFKMFKKANPNLTDQAILGAVLNPLKKMLTSLDTYNRNTTLTNLNDTVAVYKELPQFRDMDKREIQDTILLHIKTKILDNFKKEPSGYMIDGRDMGAGYALAVKRRTSDKELSESERHRRKANVNTLETMKKLRPMLGNYERALTTVNLMSQYQSKQGLATNDPNYLKLVKQLASSPNLLAKLQVGTEQEKEAYAQLKKISESGAISKDADIFSTIDILTVKAGNLINAGGYVATALKSANLGDTVRRLTGFNLDDINSPPASSSANSSTWESKVKGKLSSLRGKIEEEQQAVNEAFRTAGEDKIAKTKALARGEMLMLRTSMTYYYAGLVQGSSGGRAISNEDFENIYNALWTRGVGGHLAKGALNQLKSTLRGIERRAHALEKAIGYGPEGDTTYEDAIVAHERNVELSHHAQLTKETEQEEARVSDTSRIPMFSYQKGKPIDQKKMTQLFSIVFMSLKNNKISSKKYSEMDEEEKKAAVASAMKGLIQSDNPKILIDGMQRDLNSFQGRDRAGVPTDLKMGDALQDFLNGKDQNENTSNQVALFLEQLIDARR